MLRTESKKLSQTSIDKIRLLMRERFGWNFLETDLGDDYGIDGTVDFFEKNSLGEEVYKSYRASCQVKSSKSSKSVSFDSEHIKLWADSPLPFYLFLFYDPEDKFYWLDFQKYYLVQKKLFPEKLDQKSISIEFQEVLDTAAEKIIRDEVRISCDLAAQAIKEGKNCRLIFDTIPSVKESTYTISAKANIVRPLIAMGRDFSNQDLSNKDLRSASLMGANFTKSNLQSADLRSAALMGTFLEGTILRESDLRGAALMGSFLKGADLRGAKLDMTSIWSIGKAYDYESALFDSGVIEKINKTLDTPNLVVN